MTRPFLTARWTNLAIVTYAAPSQLLAPRLPPGLVLEQTAGDALVSLVAFRFEETRLWGIGWPGYRNFPELNLRCYVRAGSDRGVYFLREFVPARVVAWIANFCYRENYRYAAMQHRVEDQPDRRSVDFTMTCAGRDQRIAVCGKKPCRLPPQGSQEHYVTSPRYGFGVGRRGQLTSYEVRRPAWETFPVESVHVDFEWQAVFGPEWRVLDRTAPQSAALAAGSAVEVYPKQDV